MPFLGPAASYVRGMAAWIDRRRVLVLVVLSGWFVILLVVAAHAKSLWHDEVYTALLARLPLEEFWRASLNGVDLSPPLNTLLTHAVVTFTGIGPVTVRLPPLIGFVAGGGFLFLTVSRRTHALVGLLAAIVPCSTPAWDYAVEARGYGLGVGLFAAALWAWSEAAAGRRPNLHWTIMAASLCAGVWNHYYAVLMWLPIVAGEAVRQRERGFQAKPWIALTCAAAGILPLWPFIRVAASRRMTFWARPGGESVVSVYQYVLKDLLSHPFAAGLLGVLIVSAIFLPIRETPARRLARHDVAAILACLAIPGIGLALGHGTQAFTLRYMVFATAGLAFALSLLLWRFLPNTAGDLIAVAALIWPLVTLSVASIRQPPAFTSPLDERPLLVDWVKGSGTVVLTGGVDYLGLWYNLPAPARRRTPYLADPAVELRNEGTDTVEQGYLALARWTPVPVVPFGAFVSAHHHFWLYSADSSWQELRLRELNATLVERSHEPNGRGVLYEVSIP